MKKFFVTILILAGLGFLGWQIYQKVSHSGKGLTRGPRNIRVAVEVAPVKIDSIKEIGTFTGSLYPLSKFILAPKIAGRLEKILVNIGDNSQRRAACGRTGRC